MDDFKKFLVEKFHKDKYLLEKPFISIDDKLFIEPNLFYNLVKNGFSLEGIFKNLFNTNPKEKKLVKNILLRNVVIYDTSLNGKTYPQSVIISDILSKPFKIKLISKKETMDFIERLSIRSEIFIENVYVEIHKDNKPVALGKLIFTDGQVKVKIEEVYR